MARMEAGYCNGTEWEYLGGPRWRDVMGMQWKWKYLEVQGGGRVFKMALIANGGAELGDGETGKGKMLHLNR